MTANIEKHPCFNKEAKHKYARVHLPIAPKCNVQCGYCNRKYDCVNESRPGVTSSVLTPEQALEYVIKLNTQMENLSVVGIAGPGDPFANAEETMQTMRLIKKEFPDKLFCISTNGLNLYPYIDELAEIGVTHITITINSLQPEVIAEIYPWIRHEKKMYRGIQAAEILLEQQLKCIDKIKEKGIVLKINTIAIPNVNEEGIEELAQYVGAKGADLMNCIPLYPTAETLFGDLEEPSKEQMKEIRKKIEKYVAPMLHCARCRADAAGLLGQDSIEAQCALQEIANKMHVVKEGKIYTAVATFEGMLVNQHLGEAREFYIFKETPNGYKLMEQRKAPPSGLGDNRWIELAKILTDCRALLIGGIGPKPLEILKKQGMQIVEMTGMIDDGLDFIYKNKDLKTVKKTAFKCGSECKGTAQGCA